MTKISPSRIKELVGTVSFHRDRALEAANEGEDPQQVDIELWDVMENRPQDLEAAIRFHQKQVLGILESQAAGEWYDLEMWALVQEDDS